VPAGSPIRRAVVEPVGETGGASLCAPADSVQASRKGIPRGLLSVNDAVGLVLRDAQQSRAWTVPLAFLAFAVVAEVGLGAQRG
jgi:hypothetical protein